MRLPCAGCAGRPEAGLYLQLVSGICASVMGLTAKVVGGMGVPVLEIVLGRSVVVLLFSTAMLSSAGQQARWPWLSPRRWLLLVRGLVGFGAITCYYTAVQLLPLADAAVFSFLAPIFVVLLSPLVLKEGGGGMAVAAALPLCMTGVVLVAQPTFLFGSNTQPLSPAGVGIGILQAVFMAAARLCVRILGKSEPASSIIFSMAIISVVGSAALAYLVPGQALVLPPGAAAWALLLGAGLLACAVQLLATYALKLSKATPTTMMTYLAVIWGLLGDLLIFHRKPSALSLLGAALVCSSSLVIILAEKRQAAGVTETPRGIDSSNRDEDEDRAALLPPGQFGAAGLNDRGSGLHLPEAAGSMDGPSQGNYHHQEGQPRQLELAVSEESSFKSWQGEVSKEEEYGDGEGMVNGTGRGEGFRVGRDQGGGEEEEVEERSNSNSKAVIAREPTPLVQHRSQGSL